MQPLQILPIERAVGQQSPGQPSQQLAQIDLVLLVNNAIVAINGGQWESLKELLERIIEITIGQPLLENKFAQIKALVRKLPDQFAEEKITLVCLIADYLSSCPLTHRLGRDGLGQPIRWECDLLISMQWLQAAIPLAKAFDKTDLLNLLYNQADRLFTRFVVLEVIEDEIWMGVIETAGNLIDRNCWRSDYKILDYISNLKSYCHPEDFSIVIHRLLKHVIEKIPEESSVERRFNPYRAEAAAIGQTPVDERERIQIIKSCQENTAAFREDLTTIANKENLSVREKQRDIFNRYRRYFQETFVSHLQTLLGPPPYPCRYHIVAMGSVGREEITPLADLECFILMEEKKLTEEQKNQDNRRTLEENYHRENEENRRYFKKMGRLLELLVLSVGEWFSTTIPSFTQQEEILVKGFHIDPTKGPEEELWESNVLVTTIDEAKTLILKKESSSYPEEEFAKYGNDKGGNCYSLLKSASLYSSDGSEELFQDYQREIQQLLHSLLPAGERTKTCGEKIIRYTLQKRCVEFSSYRGHVLYGTVDLKEIIFRPFTLLLTDLHTSLCKSGESATTLSKTNTLDLIDELTSLFDPESLELLKILAKELHSLRINLHTYYGVAHGAVKDEASFDGTSLNHYKLTSQQQIMILAAHELVLKPLNQLLSNALQTTQKQTSIDKLILFLKKQFGLSRDSQESIFGKQHQTISFIDLAIKKLTEELELIFLADESLTWDVSLSLEDKEKAQNYLKIAPKQLVQQISLISSGLAIIDASEQRHQDVYCLIALSDQITKQRTTYWETLDWEEEKIQTQLKPLQRRQHVLISTLRENYIKKLFGYHQNHKITSILLDVPDRQGMRISTLWAEQRLSKQLTLLTQDGVKNGNITCQVRRAGSEKEFFLNADALTMIDSEGHLIHQYPHTHRGVFGYPKESPQLFLKAYPYQPMAEYADFSLKRRLGITSSPTTELVRFDLQVNGKPLSYPVLISEAVPGIPLNLAIQENRFQPDRLNPIALTLTAICELLLSPGDGRAENKILMNDGSILASIDNDIICVDPRVPSVFSQALWGRRFYFCSILFCLGNVPLDLDVLKRFAALNPSEILSGWIEDLRDKERHYLSLFPNVQERIALYDSPNPNLSFTPTWVIQERTLLRIDAQFRYLQQRIRENSIQTILNLLGCYVSLDRTDHREMIEGQRLEEAYTSAYSLKTTNPIARLEQVLNFDSKSMTNLESQKASCQTQPNGKQIENGKFCLRRAEEIYRRHQLVDQFALARIGKGEISINFSPWKRNRSKQRQLLNYLLLRIQEEKCLPISLTLIQCEVLSKTLLLSLLHNDLKELNLAKCPLQLSSNLLLTRAPHLERLILSDCPGLTTFEREFSQIQELRLDQCQNLSTIKIQAQIIHYFRLDKNPKLKTLEIGNTPIIRMIIDDHHTLAKTRKALQLERLFSNDPSLKILHLASNKIGLNSIASLAKALQHNRSLTTLDLRDNEIGNAGITSLAKALQHNSSLTKLDLSDNEIGNTGIASLSKALQHNSSLTTLDLVNISIDNAGIASFALGLQHNSSLTKLDLAKNSIDNTCIASLSKALQHNSSLTTLDLYNNNIGADGATSLAEALQHNNSLTKLNLNRNHIGPYGITSLAKALQSNSSLTMLDLRYNWIGDTGTASLALGLQHNNSLKTLYLWDTQIGAAGATSLAKALQHNSSLTTLDLSNNDISNTGITSLAETLEHNSFLTTLNLCYNKIGAAGATSLAKALQYNSSLTMLDLSRNDIGNTGIDSLAKALQSNNSLTTLHLRYNQINNTGTASLALGLQHNSSLTKLDLSNNSINDQDTTPLTLGLQNNSFLIGANGAASLAKALQSNSSLTMLDLSRNNIGNTGAASLAEALQSNSSLITLDLRYNLIFDTDATFKKIIKVALEKNKRLKAEEALKANSLPGAILEVNTHAISIHTGKKRFPSLSNDHSPLILTQEKKPLSNLSPFSHYISSHKVGAGLENSQNNCFFNAMIQFIMNSSLKDFFLDRGHLIAPSKITTQDQIDRAFAFLSEIGETYAKTIQTTTNIVHYDSSEMRSILGLSPASQEDVFQAFNALCHFYTLTTLSIPLSFTTKVDLTTKIQLEAMPDDPIEVGDDGLSSSPRIEQSLTHPLALERVPTTIQKLIEETFSREEICDQPLTFIHRGTPYSVAQFTRQLYFDPQDLKDELLFHVLRFNKKSEKIMTLLPKDLFEVSFGSDTNTVTYSLIGFIAHTGTTLESGHYVTYIKSAEGWTQWSDTIGQFFPDTALRQTSSSSAASSSSSSLPSRAAPHSAIIAAAREAYILHYHKKSPSEDNDT